MEVQRPGSEHPVLLTMPSFYGTLAAVRCFGDRGISVTVAGETPFDPARWSRYVSRWVSCPPVSEPERYLEWLIAFGKREPGHVLYPTSDELAWLFARHADALSPYFLLYQPSSVQLQRLLDKKALNELCIELGVPCPRTLFPTSVDHALLLAEELGYPLVLKPRTQMFLAVTSKGVVVKNRAQLKDEYAKLLANNAPHPSVREVLPGVERPMLQQFVPTAAGDTYSISGFIAPNGQGLATRAAIKLLQRPRQVGVGVCFEEAAVDPRALDDLQRLCERAGYFGVFEAEFLRDDGSLKLIDFNPRFFGQMGFDVMRDLPLPYLAWLGAIGAEARLAQALEAARAWQPGAGYVCCNEAFLNLTLFCQGLSGKMSSAERTRWRRWLEEPKRRALAFDLVDSPRDPLPGVASRIREAYSALRHPRAFFRRVVMGSGMLAMSHGIEFAARL